MSYEVRFDEVGMDGGSVCYAMMKGNK